MADSTPDFGTIIGADAKFKGEVTFNSAAKVMGRIEGSIRGKGTIHVSEGAQCEASVEAKEVAVEGHIDGNVKATDRIDLKPKGRITGDIIAQRMSMSDGASIVGHCQIGVSKDASFKPATTTEMKPNAESQSTPASAKARS